MDYILIRSKRKTLVIQIKKDGTVVVRAPMRLAKREIDRLVQEKQEWVQCHRCQLLELQQRRAQFLLSDGQLPLLGTLFPLDYTQEKKAFYRDGVFFLCPGNEEDLRRQAIVLYKEIALAELTRRVGFYAPKLGVSPKGLRINSAKSRWGSCSGENRLNFSWRLILAPEHCVNYVVVHELCHILHHDHSSAFWLEVARFFPDWQQCRDQLAFIAQQPWFFTE